MNGQQVVIYRGTANLNFERSVTVFHPQGGSYIVDPAREVGFVTGTSMDRTSCMISMADGFIGAGYSVVMHHADRRPYGHTKRPYTTLCYYLFGFAWTRGEWPQLASSFGYITPQSRMVVLEHTAQFYLNRSYAPDRVRLMVP